MEELERTIQSGLRGVKISVDNLNETMKAVLKIIKEM